MSIIKRLEKLGIDPATYGKNAKGEKVATGRKSFNEMAVELCKKNGMNKEQTAELCKKGISAVLSHFEPKAEPATENKKEAAKSDLMQLIEAQKELTEAIKQLVEKNQPKNK